MSDFHSPRVPPLITNALAMGRRAATAYLHYEQQVIALCAAADCTATEARAALNEISLTAPDAEIARGALVRMVNRGRSLPEAVQTMHASHVLRGAAHHHLETDR